VHEPKIVAPLGDAEAEEVGVEGERALEVGDLELDE
jgi:hypothetical protein